MHPQSVVEELETIIELLEDGDIGNALAIIEELLAEFQYLAIEYKNKKVKIYG